MRGLGGHGNFAASVAPVPEVEQPLMTEVPGHGLGACGCAGRGGPTVPVTTFFDPASFPVDEMFVRARGEQLTGMSLPRKRIWGCVGSELHCSIEANDPAVKFAPLRFTVSPPAKPEQIGAIGLELLHVTPAAVDVSVSVGAALPAALLMAATLVARRVPPLNSATTPIVERMVISRERPWDRRSRAVMCRPLSRWDPFDAGRGPGGLSRRASFYPRGVANHTPNFSPT